MITDQSTHTCFFACLSCATDALNVMPRSPAVRFIARTASEQNGRSTCALQTAPEGGSGRVGRGRRKGAERPVNVRAADGTREGSGRVRRGRREGKEQKTACAVTPSRVWRHT